MSKNGAGRILDANSNRAREGARVLEDICRLVLNDPGLSARWRRARHAVTEIIDGAGLACVDARDAESDPGGRAGWDGGENRGGCRGIASANAKRVEEGLRVLEEFSRISSAEAGEKFKRLRFEIYSLEKETLMELKKQKE